MFLIYNKILILLSSMNVLPAKSQVKVNQEQLQNYDQFDSQKEQISQNTQPPQEIKIKLEMKIPIEKKEEHIDNQTFVNQSEQTNPLNHQNQSPQNNQHIFKRTRRPLSHHERLQDVRLVAATFIEYGLNFRKFNQFYPDIDAKFYRNTVQAINNTSINEIEKYLRYECNIQIEKLNRDQKRSIRTQLTRVRDWLGKKDMGQLQTLYKFIQRKYELIDVEISIEEALKLYKTILQIVKSPFVDVMEDEIKPETLDPEINKLASKEERQMQQKTLIFLYVQHRNLTKVSDLLCEKFGYTIKWSKHAVKQKIKYLLLSSLKKLIGSVEAYDKPLKLFFSESDECINLLIKSENSLNLKVFLLGFYLQKTITLIELRQYIKMVNKFFIQQYKGHGQYECKQFQQSVKIPKLETKGSEQQKISLEDHSNKIETQKYEQKTIQYIKEQKATKSHAFQADQKQMCNEKKKKDQAVLDFSECFQSEFDIVVSEQNKIKLEP